MLDLQQESTAIELVDLRKIYPMSGRLILRRMLGAIVGIILLGFSHYTALDAIPVGDETELYAITLKITNWVLAIGLILFAAKFIYELIYFSIYKYRVELEHLVITKGIFLKSRSSFPLAKINDVHLHRNVLDFICAIYNLKVLTPSPVDYLGEIEGLSPKVAVQLQNHLLAMVETTLPAVNPQAAKESIQGDNPEVDNEDEIKAALHPPQKANGPLTQAK